MGKFLLDISDKIIVEEELYCPSHRIPHSLPIIGELIIDERCHYHNSKLRMLHHKTFRKIFKCPN